MNLEANSKRGINTYLFLLFVEVVDDDTYEEVERKEGAEDDEEHEVDVHVYVGLVLRLLVQLKKVFSHVNNCTMQTQRSCKNGQRLTLRSLCNKGDSGETASYYANQ